MSRPRTPAPPVANEAPPTSPEPQTDRLVGRLTMRLDELARALGVSRRAIERERSAGRFPKPDLTVGRMPLWAPATIQRWIEGGGRA